MNEEHVAGIEGSVIEAVVASITEDHVLVTLEGHGQGVVPRSELGRDPNGATVGERFSVYVEQESGNRWVVSREKAERLAVLANLERAYKAGEEIQGEIVGEMTGGFAVDVGLKAFLPASQFGLRIPRDPDEVVGQSLGFKIIRFDRARTNVVLSRRALLEAERDKTMDRMKVGSIVEGTVMRLTEFGAFVDIGMMEGLLHVSDISWGKIKHPSEVVTVGQKLTLKVLRLDKQSQKLSLGLRQIEDDPWVQAKAKYPVGAKVRGLVVSKTDYGCFIEVEPGLEGLVHSTGPMVTDVARDRLRKIEIGEDIGGVVLDLDLTAKRLSLTLDESTP